MGNGAATAMRPVYNVRKRMGRPAISRRRSQISAEDGRKYQQAYDAALKGQQHDK